MSFLAIDKDFEYKAMKNLWVEKRSKLIIGLVILSCILLLCVSTPTLFRVVMLPYLRFFPIVEHSPFSVEEASKIEGLPPLYRPAPHSNTPYANLDLIHYYYANLAELILEVYFVDTGPNSEPNRVAKIVVFRHVTPRINYLDKQQIRVTWQDRDFVELCGIDSNEEDYDRDGLAGEHYQSCVYWRLDGDFYVLYTIWPEDETVDFINSLVIVE